jgi:hypothetical protein
MAGGTERDVSELTEWVARVLHDLVKYLEMMPRSLDWDALEDDDADVLYEAVFETRSGREGSQTALTIWRVSLDSMPSAGSSVSAMVERVSASLEELERLVSELDGSSLADADTGRIRRLIFSVGDELRAFRDELGTH